MATAQELSQALEGFTGTENYFTHPFNRSLWWTDGVKYFAEQAKAFWFLDAMAIGVNGKPGPVPAAVPGKDHFAVVLLESRPDSIGHIEVVSDYDENDESVGEQLWGQSIQYTDCPEGIWKFFLQHDGEHTVMMLPSEY